MDNVSICRNLVSCIKSNDIANDNIAFRNFGELGFALRTRFAENFDGALVLDLIEQLKLIVGLLFEDKTDDGR